LTDGITEEEYLAVVPDGKSLLTSVGSRSSTIWLHDSRGEHQLTSEGYAFLPTIAPDSKFVYYLKESGAAQAFVSGEIWRVDPSTRQAERVLPGFVVAHFDISPDGQQIVFASVGAAGAGIWIAPLDRNSPPRALTSDGEYRAFFVSNSRIVYGSRNPPRHLFAMNADGSGRTQIFDQQILHLLSVSPDAKWAAMILPTETEKVRVVAYPLQGGTPNDLCRTCIGGFGPSRVNAPVVNWSRDGRFLYASLQFFAAHEDKTLVIPVKAGTPGPLLAPSDAASVRSRAATPGARLIDEMDVFPGPTTPDMYVYTKRARQTNLFRISLSP
jgi:hypothetical protein